MNSLDTNLVLRFLLNDVPAQTTRARILIMNSPVYISDVVIVETVYVLEKILNYDRRFISGILKMFLSIPSVSHNDHVLVHVIDLFQKKSFLSIVDCYAATEAKIFGTKLFTFDRKLISQGGAHVQAP